VSEDTGPLIRLEHQLGRLLLAGVSISALCLAAGLVLFSMDHASTAAARLLSVGLIVLMATPILRVLVSVVEYVRIRDWFFVLTTVVVLAELALTVFYAFRHRV
jgi:uncharacterized membrane protein